MADVRPPQRQPSYILPPLPHIVEGEVLPPRVQDPHGKHPGTKLPAPRPEKHFTMDEWLNLTASDRQRWGEKYDNLVRKSHEAKKALLLSEGRYDDKPVLAAV